MLQLPSSLSKPLRAAHLFLETVRPRSSPTSPYKPATPKIRSKSEHAPTIYLGNQLARFGAASLTPNNTTLQGKPKHSTSKPTHRTLAAGNPKRLHIVCGQCEALNHKNHANKYFLFFFLKKKNAAQWAFLGWCVGTISLESPKDPRRPGPCPVATLAVSPFGLTKARPKRWLATR